MNDDVKITEKYENNKKRIYLSSFKNRTNNPYITIIEDNKIIDTGYFNK